MWHSYTSKEIEKMKKETKKMIDELSNEEFIEFFYDKEKLKNDINNENDKNLPF